MRSLPAAPKMMMDPVGAKSPWETPSRQTRTPLAIFLTRIVSSRPLPITNRAVLLLSPGSGARKVWGLAA